jgi:hypothetical protein
MAVGAAKASATLKYSSELYTPYAWSLGQIIRCAKNTLDCATLHRSVLSAIRGPHQRHKRRL